MPDDFTTLSKESTAAPVTTNQSTAQMSDLPAPSQVWRDIPMDIYKHFNVDFFEASDKHVDEMKSVTSWAAKRGNGRPGDMMQRLQELENRLGAPNIGETRLTKMYNWIEVQNAIIDMRKKAKVMENGLRRD